MYTCPVCLYDKMEYPPERYNICRRCGTEFGYDDFALTHEQLREEWIQKGRPWLRPEE